ncbi:hypothetical protein [Prevotella sp. KH2C16]|uniref:hypothetical protein n=1 Tax=Prevotella sp. KH2C16 TaxID=1855325 RepID=UPI0008E294E8|nr:hypothetical protein SAMN05216383_10764 [Prevotella sp. KH2C16]
MFLVAGAVITLLYLLFGTPLYEALYYEREFSNEMYNENLYLTVSIVTTLVAWGFAGIYYYVVNSVSFSRWYHWLIVLIAASVVAPLINFVYPNSIFNGLGYDFSAQLFSFCMVDLAIEAILFIVVSFSIRWWSSNCRHTPIPE